MLLIVYGAHSELALWCAPSSAEHTFPQSFEGCKVVIQKGLSRHFQTMHTLTLGSSTQPAQWQFGATYVGSKRVAENDVRFVTVLHVVWM